MSDAAPTGNTALVRIVAMSLLFALVNMRAWHRAIAGPDPPAPPAAAASAPYYSADGGLTSRVGLVTTDGLWDADPGGKYADAEIKILGFTDINYVDVARLWYTRLTLLVSSLLCVSTASSCFRGCIDSHS